MNQEPNSMIIHACTLKGEWRSVHSGCWLCSSRYSRDTICKKNRNAWRSCIVLCHRGVYADFHPSIPEAYRSSSLLFLANIGPQLQLEVLEQVSDACLSVLDMMELWIKMSRLQLTEVIKRVDVLLMSEEEMRQYTNRASIVAGASHLLDMGLQYVVVKQGSYGALLFGADGTYFSAPSYPLEEVIDGAIASS